MDAILSKIPIEIRGKIVELFKNGIKSPDEINKLTGIHLNIIFPMVRRLFDQEQMGVELSPHWKIYGIYKIDNTGQGTDPPKIDGTRHRPPEDRRDKAQTPRR